LPACEGGTQGDDGSASLTLEEYEELADLWTAAPSGEERRDLQRLFKRTPGRARVTQYGELVVVVLLAAAIMGAMALRLGPATLLTGGLVLLLLGWSAWKRHNLTNLALLIDQRDSHAFICSMVRSKEAEAKRSALGLAFILPGTLLTMLLGYSVRGHGEGADLASFLVSALTTPRGLIASAFLLCAVMILALSHMRLLDELRRLRDLRADYEEERRRDRTDWL
jgi:hypothetical protein